MTEDGIKRFVVGRKTPPVNEYILHFGVWISTRKYGTISYCVVSKTNIYIWIQCLRVSDVLLTTTKTTTHKLWWQLCSWPLLFLGCYSFLSLFNLSRTHREEEEWTTSMRWWRRRMRPVSGGCTRTYPPCPATCSSRSSRCSTSATCVVSNKASMHAILFLSSVCSHSHLTMACLGSGFL